MWNSNEEEETERTAGEVMDGVERTAQRLVVRQDRKCRT